MEWLTKRINELQQALNEVEHAQLTNETKMVVLKSLKDELNSLKMQKNKINETVDFVENGFNK